ncbi:MAG TPA: glycosyltransferase family 2 protein [Vicinamibacteria bacterium]
MNDRLLVVIPARNEATNLPAVIGELRGSGLESDIVVVDDDSRDGTAAVARGFGCVVLELPFHLGYGAAVQTGVKYALRKGYEVVVTFDGDGQHDPADVAGLVAAVDQGADLAIGSRFLDPRSYRGGPLRRFGRAMLAALSQVLGMAMTDPTSGLKALGRRGQALFAMARFPDRFPDADALIVARRSRLKVVERPARMRRSRNRHSMHDGHRAVAYAFNMLLSLLVAAAGREVDLGG